MRYAFTDIYIDEEGFEIYRARERVAIEPRVLEFILYLIRNRARVVSKLELLDSLWRDSHVVEAVVARCACVARKALGDPALIRTVYGRGYRWSAPHMRIVDPPSDKRINYATGGQQPIIKLR